MRATDLGLRNPKEFTPDACYPKVTCDGRALGVKARAHSFGRASRFSITEDSRIGPGTYNLNNFTFIKPSVLLTPRFRASEKVDPGNNGYIMIGDAMVYDQKYSVRRSSVSNLRCSASPRECSRISRRRSVVKRNIVIRSNLKRRSIR